MNNTGLNNTNASGDFTKGITGLSPNTTYWYLAYVKEYNASTSSVEPRVAATAQSFKTKAIATATATVSTASNIAQTSATLNGGQSGASGALSAYGFYYGTSTNAITTRVVTNGAPSASFSYNLSGLTANTTYYYKSFVVEANENTGATEERVSSSYQSFTTLQAQQQQSSLPRYLGCYEMPDVSGILSGSSESGNNSGRDDVWYRYYTNNNKRQIATHTFTHPTSNKIVRNYTVLYDENKYAPVWTAHAMHASMWLDDNTGRTGSWGTDPAISLTQQTGLDNAGTVGYSRGHFVASNYRQSSAEQNNQTFYYTNQAPQWQNSFNGGVWMNMEQAIASAAPSGRDTLYVVIGVLYEESWYSTHPDQPRTLPSGSLTVPIPSHFYTCLMKCSFNTSGTMTAASGIAFVMSNVPHSGAKYYDTVKDSVTNENESFTSSIDAIEERAGFDFFAAVPSSLQASAEANTDHNWFTGN